MPLKRFSAHHKYALLLCLLLFVIAVGSFLWIFLYRPPDAASLLYADIYQDGELKQSILLSADSEEYSFTIHYREDSFNEICVRQQSIGIINASCPDKVCIHQGFIDNSLLPITCLPNRLVIRLREEHLIGDTRDNGLENTPDIITY